ncbi:MAG: hypothetical protein C0402_06690 [Thermodesulfovibrio sp.]|nr:hypothetical protein [Thermodesulfovibrio sp.]
MEGESVSANESKQNLDVFKDEYLCPGPDRRVDQHILDLVCDFVLPKISGSRALELGVGDQVWTPKLLERFESVTSVDGSKELLTAMAQKVKGRDWTAVNSFFEDYIPVLLFDTVLITYVLEHVDDPLLILRHARRRWLKEGGRLAVVVPHALSLHRRLAVKMGLASHPAELGDTDRRMGHKHCFTSYEMEKMIINAGFRIIEVKGMFTKVLPNSMLTGCSDEQLKGLFELGLSLPVEYSAAIFILAETAPV